MLCLHGRAQACVLARQNDDDDGDSVSRWDAKFPLVMSGVTNVESRAGKRQIDYRDGQWEQRVMGDLSLSVCLWWSSTMPNGRDTGIGLRTVRQKLLSSLQQRCTVKIALSPSLTCVHARVQTRRHTLHTHSHTLVYLMLHKSCA